MDKRQKLSHELRIIVNHVHQYNIKRAEKAHTRQDRLQVKYGINKLEIYSLMGMPMWISDELESLARALGYQSYVSTAYIKGTATVRLSILR